MGTYLRPIMIYFTQGYGYVIEGSWGSPRVTLPTIGSWMG